MRNENNGGVMKRLVMVLLLTVPLGAQFHRVASAQEFERLINKYAYSVACFAPASKQEGEDLTSDELKERKKSFKELVDIQQSAASKPEFKRFLSKDLGFIAVDVAAKRAQDLVKNYHISKTPVCHVFQEGALVKGSQLVNPTSTKDVVDLLEDNAGSDLQGLLADRKEQQSQDRQERIARYYAYGGYYPYAWGYGWGGSSYWARPYWGWGYLI